MKNKQNGLIVATENAGKMREIGHYIKGAKLNFGPLLSLGDINLNINLDAVENGTTFEENARKKAAAVRAATGGEFFVLADDSGLVIDFLGGQPGVNSANFMGRDTPYATRHEAILRQMEGVDGNLRSARFVCVMALALPNEILTFKGEVEGEIARQPAGEGGFGYDPIFFLPQFGLTAAQLDLEQKNAISHRGRALASLLKYLSVENF